MQNPILLSCESLADYFSTASNLDKANIRLKDSNTQNNSASQNHVRVEIESNRKSRDDSTVKINFFI